MEAIIVIILFLFGGFIFKAITAGGKSLVTGQSFSESYRGFPDWNLKIEHEKIDNNSKNPIYHKVISCRGIIPVHTQKSLAVLVRLLDITDNKNNHENKGPWANQTVNKESKVHPVVTFLDTYQCPGSTIFEFYRPFGIVYPNTGYKDWIKLANIPIEFLQTAYSGERKIRVICIIEDTENPYTSENSSGVVDFKTFEFSYNFKTKGYLEVSKDIEKGRGLAVKIAIGVAMADGSLDEKEGEVIKNWIKKTISIYDEEKKKELKNIYNNAFKEAYKLAKGNKLVISDLTSELNELNENKIKYDAMELCYEVMAADGVADSEELKTIRAIGEILEIDANEIEKMRDKNLVNLSSEATSAPSVEDVLGIDKSWSKEKIKSHLTTEFQKWNNRISSLPEGNEKNNAQSMLNKIAEIRKKYGI